MPSAQTLYNDADSGREVESGGKVEGLIAKIIEDEEKKSE